MTLIVFPVAINVSLISPKDKIHPLISVNFSAADLLLAIILMLWIIKLFLDKQIRQIKLPSAAILTFTGIGVLSIVNAISITEWLKELIQIVEYFIIFYMLLLNNMQKVKILLIKNILFISTTLILLLAFVQYFILNGSPYLIRGLFENHNILGVFLCILIPLVFTEILYTSDVFRKAWMLLLLLLSILVMTSGSAIVSICLTLFIVSFLHSKKMFLRYTFFFLLLFPVYIFIMPPKNVNSLKEFFNIYEKGNIDENYYRIQTILYDIKKSFQYTKPVGNDSLSVSSNIFISSTLPETKIGESYKDLVGKKLIKNRYMEMQATMNMISDNILTGVGLGNFQANIGSYYKELPKINTAEPSQHNGYLIIGATTGILGLAALLWLLVFSLKMSYVNFKRTKNSQEHCLYLGLFGSILACMVENNFTNLFSAGLLVPVILIIFLSTSENIDVTEK